MTIWQKNPTAWDKNLVALFLKKEPPNFQKSTPSFSKRLSTCHIDAFPPPFTSIIRHNSIAAIYYMSPLEKGTIW